MPRPADEMDDILLVCPGVQEMSEGGVSYFFLPGLKSPGAPGTIDALLCPQQHSGYATRLFLSAQIPGKGNNWSTHVILGRAWHTWSWNHVPANQRLAEILAQHLRALK